MRCGVGVCVWGKGVGVVLLVVIFSSQVHTTFTCPKDCFCAPHSKNVQCANKEFQKIPDGIPTETLELNLNENKFKNTALTRRNFTELYNLERLYMIDCGIETIAVETFADLVQLSWLDLSKNNIRFIADYTFRGLHLKHLFLNDNNGIQLSIGAFAGMTTQGLYMHNCGLRRLPVDLMTPLNGSLKTLWLDGNNFEAFSDKWLYFFQNLAHIRLGGNSFHCNCEIHWFYAFFKKSRTSLFAGREQPQCASPRIVKGKNFDELTDEDFRCELPTFKNVDAVFDSKMGKLTCQASGDPAPTLYWIRPDGTTETYYPRGDHEGQENMGVMFMTDLKLDSKDAYKCVASNPAGNVTFSLNVVWPDIRPPPPPTPKPTKPPTRVNNDNVIRADSSSTPTNKIFKPYARDDSGVYDLSNVNSKSSKMANSDKPHEPLATDGDNHFSIVDIVGAVVGTFLLTLLISVTLFHFYYRRRERERMRQDDHYSVPDEVNNKRGPNSVFIMNEAEENRIKMINHHNNAECPS
ncbi:leucine-rich repeat and fibronectin type-III domain-containing protein 5 [Aplysia californica]|uniref:Leucine-rich repeat and fibronectin type-III domain-containing protein 5 n=1 Tax=Aplysia californica TaxID=6500 RepID=A0ABM0JE52_APLCA|nr:leucine-rich repeat and fibronectin type-III domain-containing protein 5 [Aplysia californica]